MNWWKKLKGKVRLEEPLKRHTTFKIGGPARIYIEPKDVADLKLLLILLKKYKIPFFVIGAGSNLLITDKGLDAAVISLSSPDFKTMRFEDSYIEVGAGESLASLVSACAQRGLSGVEYLSGIPGTVGAALVMNAGQSQEGFQIGDIVQNVTVMDYNGKIKKLLPKQIKFSYRASNLSKYVVLSARMRLLKANKSSIGDTMRTYIAYRKSNQDYSFASAGCVFKNPKNDSAGRLIDLCGLKGKRVGGAVVSSKHANFIVNKGKASAEDVLKLMNLIRKEVKAKFKISLEPEVKIWQ